MIDKFRVQMAYELSCGKLHALHSYEKSKAFTHTFTNIDGNHSAVTDHEEGAEIEEGHKTDYCNNDYEADRMDYQR